jgi:hypothetical protein
MFSFGRIQLRRFFLSSVLSLLVFLLFFWIGSAYSAQVTLAWDPNTEPDVAGYRIYYGLESDPYSNRIDVGNQISYTVASLAEGKTYYFAATAYDQEGNESDFSDEVAFNVPVPCTFTVSPSSQSFDQAGGPSTINVTTQSGCMWTAISNVSWSTFTSNSSVTGSGVLNYSVLANPNASSRTGTLTIAGQTFTATQSGGAQYTLGITRAGTGSGTVTNNPTGTTFSAGTVVTLTATPDANSTFTGWSGGSSGTSSTTTVTMNGNTSVIATFMLKTFTITASAGSNGSISPKGTLTVNSGGRQTFTIKPRPFFFKIADVKVDGVSKGPITSYTFSNVTSNHSISATFVRRGSK